MPAPHFFLLTRKFLSGLVLVKQAPLGGDGIQLLRRDRRGRLGGAPGPCRRPAGRPRRLRSGSPGTSSLSLRRPALRCPRSPGPLPLLPCPLGAGGARRKDASSGGPSPPLLAGAPGTRESPPQAPGRARGAFSAAGEPPAPTSLPRERGTTDCPGPRWRRGAPADRCGDRRSGPQLLPSRAAGGGRGAGRRAWAEAGVAGTRARRLPRRRSGPETGGSEGSQGSARRSAPPRAGARLTPETLPLDLPPLCSPALSAESRFPLPPPELSPGF